MLPGSREGPETPGHPATRRESRTSGNQRVDSNLYEGGRKQVLATVFTETYSANSGVEIAVTDDLEGY